MTTIALPHEASAVRDRSRAVVGPNWFSSVMGTGIVAVALVGLPFQLPYAGPLAAGVWALAVILLVAVTVAAAGHLTEHLDDPVLAHFYGAPAMALMTVGAGAVLAGHRLVGTGPALALDVVLWTAGTLLGLVTTVLVPYRAITRHDLGPASASGTWLMPVVPPMVSAATGALLVPHLPAGQARETLLLACYAFFGIALVASLLMITLLWGRLLRHGVGPAAAVPTLWIVLGPLGQSITAAHHLGEVAPGAAPQAFALAYGVPVWGFAMTWLALVVMLTLRTIRSATGLPFSLAWWSFTFPVGTMVTGTSALASATGLVVLEVASGALFAFLVVAWATVLTRTLRERRNLLTT